eukprot:g9638.t1
MPPRSHTKRNHPHRQSQEEIAALEAQMGTASTYAAAGLKKRLQTLKAAALREDRAAQARAAAARAANHVNTSVTCCTILGDRLKIQEELQELCRGAANGDFIHLAAPEAPVEVPVEVPVLPVAPAPLPLTTLVPAPVPMPVGPVRPVSENAGFQWQASSEKLLYSRSTKPQPLVREQRGKRPSSDAWGETRWRRMRRDHPGVAVLHSRMKKDLHM